MSIITRLVGRESPSKLSADRVGTAGNERSHGRKRHSTITPWDDPHLPAPSTACHKVGEEELQDNSKRQCRADGAPVFPDAVRAPVRKRTPAVLSLSSNENQPVFFPDLKDECA